MDHITLTHCTKICWTRLHLQSFIWNLPRSKCYMHYNPLLFWGKLYMRVISHHTWNVTTHPDSLVQVEQWMVHSTFFLNLPTNITNQRFTITLKVREEKRLSYYGTKLEIEAFLNLHSYNLKPKTEFWSISKHSHSIN